MKTIVEKYRDLPGCSYAAPDAIWDWHGALREFVKIEWQLSLATVQLEAAKVRALKGLRGHWTDEELRAAGLLD